MFIKFGIFNLCDKLGEEGCSFMGQEYSASLRYISYLKALLGQGCQLLVSSCKVDIKVL